MVDKNRDIDTLRTSQNVCPRNTEQAQIINSLRDMTPSEKDIIKHANG